jgi:hypothetical protein
MLRLLCCVPAYAFGTAPRPSRCVARLPIQVTHQGTCKPSGRSDPRHNLLSLPWPLTQIANRLLPRYERPDRWSYTRNQPIRFQFV